MPGVPLPVRPARYGRRLERRTWRLRVTTHPPGALLSIRPAAGPARRVRTPFRGTVAGGELELAVAKTGYNRLVQRLPLDRHRSLDLWLDPAGLLHHKTGVVRTGPAPQQVAPGVYLVTLGKGAAASNSYVVRSGPTWTLIDTGWASNAASSLTRAGDSSA